MLVISRKPGESLILSDNIKITILSVGNDKVAIGIDAPRSVSIIREELQETIQANKDSVSQHNDESYANIASMLKSNKVKI
ncbi:MAG: carbon storage regulator CsrA [Clostridiales bacterium]|nr:carbon storage regulator CsrA [Clostridiales bacterium]